MKYYYTENNQKKGPFSIDQLKDKNLNENTLIWHNGLEKWTLLKNIPDLHIMLSKKNKTKYFLLKNKIKTGPFYLEDLEEKGITPTSLIWTKKLDVWTHAKEIDELENIIMPDIPVEADDTHQVKKDAEKVQLGKPKSNISIESNIDLKNNKEVYNTGDFFQRPFFHKGRIGRIEYLIILILCIVVIPIVQGIGFESGIYRERGFLFYIFLLFYVVLAYFFIISSAKRSHDLGYSGWLQIIPLYQLYLLFAPGQKFNNKYGNPPK